MSQTVKNLPAKKEMQVQSLGQEDPSPGEGNGNPLQYSCLENPMDRGAWWAIVHGVAKSQTQLSMHEGPHIYTQTHSKENNTFIYSKNMYGGRQRKVIIIRVCY